MQRKVLCIVIVLIVSVLLFACSSEPELELGTYVSETSTVIESFPDASLSLESDNEFMLYGPAFISLVMDGKYKIADGKLTLTSSNDDVHVFTIYDDTLVFESGEWLGNWIEQGTEFHLSSE
ncbi:hypothetical protein LJC56_11845 [Christensenellaceae bacterium OttesenSCG-928-K19]|nr:hypothetical protein [Christensenellaceae bacterium OttesenSCG-928-K19]